MVAQPCLQGVSNTTGKDALQRSASVCLTGANAKRMQLQSNLSVPKSIEKDKRANDVPFVARVSSMLLNEALRRVHSLGHREKPVRGSFCPREGEMKETLLDAIPPFLE